MATKERAAHRKRSRAHAAKRTRSTEKVRKKREAEDVHRRGRPGQAVADVSGPLVEGGRSAVGGRGRTCAGRPDRRCPTTHPPTSQSGALRRPETTGSSDMLGPS